MTVQLLINGGEVSVRRLTVTDEGKGKLTFLLRETVSVDVGDSVEVKKDGSTIAKGKVTKIVTERKHHRKTVHCIGMTDILYREVVLDSDHHVYSNMDAGAIVKDLIDHYFYCRVLRLSENWKLGNYDQWARNVYGSITDSIVDGEEKITDATKSGGSYWIYDNTDKANQHRAKILLPSPPFTVEFDVRAEDTAASQMGQVGIGLTDQDGYIQVWCGLSDWYGNLINLQKEAKITGTSFDGAASSGTKYHFKIDVTATSIKVYVDDALFAEKDDSPSLKYLSIAVGAYGGYPFLQAGYIDNIKLKETLTSNNVNTSTGTTINRIDGYGRTVGDVIEELAERAGCCFYVDNSDDVHFFPEGAESTGLTIN